MKGVWSFYNIINTTEQRCISEALPNLRTEVGSHILASEKYNLKVLGKTVCPKAFAILQNVSYNKLLEIAKSTSTVAADPIQEPQVAVLLKCVFTLKRLYFRGYQTIQRSFE